METDFGFDFDYASWDANTELMLTNVPWNSDYRDIVQMDSLDDLNAWLETQPNWKYTNASMQKFNDGIVKIDLPLNEAMKYNYLRTRNGVNPVTTVSRDYFYFITGIRYGAPNTTYVSLQLDAITTFLPEVSFGQSYVEHGHIAVANSNAFDDFGRDYLTLPEGLDIGGEYRTVHVEFQRIMDLTDASTVEDGHGFDILVCSTLDLTQDPGTVTDPHLNSSTGSDFQGIPAGASFYLFRSGAELLNFFNDYSGKPWITQSIISITLIPNMQRYVPAYDYGTDLSVYSGASFYKAGADTPQPYTRSLLPDWRNSEFITDVLGPEYASLKKFLTYPYMVVELTTWTASPLIIKPEAWQDPDATVTELAALLPPAQRIVIVPKRYNADAETQTATQDVEGDGYDDYGDSLDFAATLDNFVQVPVVNNSYLGFLASNKNGIAFSFTNADWGQQRALAGAQAGYDVQNAQIANMGRQAGIANTQQANTSALGATTSINNAALGMATGGVGGVGDDISRGGDPMTAIAGGALNAAGGMMQAGNSANASLQSAQYAIGARGESAISDIRTAGSVRDTNNAFATMAAKGDYRNNIAGIQAKLQDARMLQPSVSGQFNGDAFNLINGKFGYSLRFKMLNKNAMRQIGNYWLRYGYAVQQFLQMPTSLHCMTKFTYWKLSETYISQAAIPEGFKQIIRGVFEKGVTVWKHPTYIGNTALSDNQPLDGIFY